MHLCASRAGRVLGKWGNKNAEFEGVLEGDDDAPPCGRARGDTRTMLLP